MPHWAKLAAVLCCLSPAVSILVGTMVTPSASAPIRPQDVRRFAHRGLPSPPSPLARAATLAPVAVAEVGALVLLVDAFRREYDAPSGLPIALALMGATITFGLTSILYYFGWGLRPSRRDGPSTAGTTVPGGAFCDAYLRATLDRRAPNTGTLNFLGSMLIGAADPCPRCGSVVRTLWVCLMVPVVPLASYRVRRVGAATVTSAGYVGRRLPGLCWGQVAAVFAVLLGFGGVVTALVCVRR